MSFDLPADVILPVRNVSVRLDPAPHPFGVANEEAIAQHWRRAVTANPALFNGEVALLSSLRMEDGDLIGRRLRQ